MLAIETKKYFEGLDEFSVSKLRWNHVPTSASGSYCCYDDSDNSILPESCVDLTVKGIFLS